LPKRSKLYKPYSVSVVDFVTENITGTPVRITSRKHEAELCEANGVSPYDDYKETFKNSAQKMAKEEFAEMDTEGVDVSFGEVDIV
jgi:hypothetical protein